MDKVPESSQSIPQGAASSKPNISKLLLIVGVVFGLILFGVSGYYLRMQPSAQRLIEVFPDRQHLEEQP